MIVHHKNLTAPLAAVVLLLCGISCSVNQEYDVDVKEIDTEVTLFGQGLSIPIGSSEKISVGSLLNSAGESLDKFLKTKEGGDYFLNYEGNTSLTDKIASMNLSSMAQSDGFSFTNEFQHHLGDFGNDFKIPEEKISVSMQLPAMEEPDVKVNAITADLENLGFNAGLSQYGNLFTGNENLNLAGKIGTVNYNQGIAKPDVTIGGGAGTIDIPADKLPDVAVPASNIAVNVADIKLHDDVTGIKNVKTSAGAQMVVTLKVQDCFLSAGNITPNINLDLSKVFKIKGGSVINLSSLVLKGSNGWTASQSYEVEGLTKTEFGSTISLSESIGVGGSIAFSNAQTTADVFNAAAGSNLSVAISFKDLKVESADIEVKPIAHNVQDVVSLGKVENVQLAKEVKDVKSIVLDATQPIVFKITPANLDRLKSKSIPYTIEMTFPASIEVEGAVGGKLSFTGNLANGAISKEIPIKAFHPTVANGVLSLNGDVNVSANITATNLVISSADLPTKASEDISFAVAMEGTPKIKDYVLVINEIEKAADYSGEMNVGVNGLEQFGEFSIIPDGTPVLKITTEAPGAGSISAAPGAEGVKFTLPNIFEFDAAKIDEALSFNAQENSIVIKNAFPPVINLPIKQINVNPVTVEGEAKVVAAYAFKGKVVIPSSEVTYSELKKVFESPSGIAVVIPEIKAKSVSIKDKINIEVEESQKIDITVDTGDAVKKIDEIELDEVYFNLNASFTGLPDVGAPFAVDLVLTLPDFIVPNQIPVKGNIQNGKLSVSQKIDKLLNLDGSKISGNASIKGSLSSEGKTLDLSTLASDIKAVFSASIQDKNGKIGVKKATGTFSYSVDQSTSISLSSFPDKLKEEGVNLDLADPQLLLNITTNLGIPLVGDIELTPVVKQKPVEANKIVVKGVRLPSSTSSATNTTKSFVICQNAATAPAGYEVLQAQIKNLLSQIPDELKVSIKAAVDETVKSVVEPKASYILDIAYAINVPLQFGENFRFSAESDLDISSAASLTSMGDFGIKGKVLNESPLNLNVEMKLLDENGQLVPQSKKSDINIAGKATSDIEFYLSPSDKNKKVSKARMIIVVTAKPGVTLNESNGIQFTELVAVAPEGLTF